MKADSRDKGNACYNRGHPTAFTSMQSVLASSPTSSSLLRMSQGFLYGARCLPPYLTEDEKQLSEVKYWCMVYRELKLRL